METSSAQTNVDPDEVRKFGSLAEQWWDPKGELRTLHQINPIRIDYVERFARLDGAEALDLGCGGGIVSEGLARRGAKVLGADMAEESVAIARAHCQGQNLNVSYVRASAEELARDMPGRFDVVTCMELIEHVPHPASLVRAAAALLKPGGSCFFTTVNRNAASFIQAIVIAEWVLGFLKRGTHDFRRFVRPSELARMARQAGLVVDDVSGMGYNPVANAFYLRADPGVNYLARCVKPMGAAD